MVSTKGNVNVRLKSRGIEGLSPGLRDDLHGALTLSMQPIELMRKCHFAEARRGAGGTAPSLAMTYSAMLFRGHEGRKQVCQQKGVRLAVSCRVLGAE